MAKRRKKKRETTSNGFEKFTKVVNFIFSLSLAILKIFAMLFFLLILGSFLGLMVPEDLELGNVAVIPIKGVITTSTDTQFIPGANSKSIVELIQKAEEKTDIKAILLEIDSPGGAPVASDEIATAVLSAKKPTVAVIRETGASGAYWIASAADKVYANRMSITGSIGVRASRLEFAGLIEDYNITYRRLVAGKYKDTGSIWKEMSAEEEKLYQNILDKLHDEFIQVVSENRELPEEKVRELATGFVFLGSEAKELGLVDELGSKKDALDHLEKELNITAETVTYKKRSSVFEDLAGVSSSSFYSIGQGIGSVFLAEEQPLFSLS